MKSYLISYDLGSPETRSDYSALYKYLKTFFLWARPLQSVWFVKSELTVSQIREQIREKLDSNDKVLVIEVKNHNWATANIQKSVTEWMKTNL